MIRGHQRTPRRRGCSRSDPHTATRSQTVTAHTPDEAGRFRIFVQIVLVIIVLAIEPVMRAEFLTALQLSLSTRDGEPFFTLTRHLGVIQPAETSGTGRARLFRYSFQPRKQVRRGWAVHPMPYTGTPQGIHEARWPDIATAGAAVKVLLAVALDARAGQKDAVAGVCGPAPLRPDADPRAFQGPGRGGDGRVRDRGSPAARRQPRERGAARAAVEVRGARICGSGAVLIDIRADSQVARDGIVAGALVIPRNVLEWRLDPASEHRQPRRRSVITSS